MKALFQLLRIFRKLSPDIIHTHSSKAGIIGRLAAFFSRIPIIIHTIHGFPFSSFQPLLMRNFYIFCERIISLITNHIIFVSKGDIEIAKTQHIRRNNFSLIRSGFPFNNFLKKKVNPDLIRNKYHIKKSDFVCGMIAPFKPQKGLFHLVDIAHEVLKKRKDVFFFVAGDGELKKDFVSTLKKKNIFHYFCLPGFIFDVNRVIDIFDIGISTALWEGLPQSLVQMRLKKLPIVASSITGNNEIVKENKNGYLVNVRNHKKFAERILHLLTHEKERERLAEFEEDFSQWDADMMVRNQEKLYLSLLSNN